MARPSNTFDSVTLTIAITPQIRAYLDDLTLKGTFGCSPAEAARMLLSAAIENKLKEGELEKRKFIVQDGAVVAVPDAA
jgi:hypothetical protein